MKKIKSTICRWQSLSLNRHHNLTTRNFQFQQLLPLIHSIHAQEQRLIQISPSTLTTAITNSMYIMQTVTDIVINGSSFTSNRLLSVPYLKQHLKKKNTLLATQRRPITLKKTSTTQSFFVYPPTKPLPVNEMQGYRAQT